MQVRNVMTVMKEMTPARAAASRLVKVMRKRARIAGARLAVNRQPSTVNRGAR
jgi:hypothetical protein